MEFDPSRLRRGELLAGASAVLLAILMVGVNSYGAGSGKGSSHTGWQALTDLRWLLLVTIVAAVALVVVQASHRAPALPVTMSLVVMLLGIVTVLALIYRVVINPPPHQEVGAWLGLLSALGIMAGGYLSLRQEGVARRDERRDIPIVRPGTGIES